MVAQRHETTADGYKFVWDRCCCGVKCYVDRDHGPDVRDTVQYVGEFEFDETIEKTAERYQAAAIERAKEVLK